ncbi:MAG: hypothetical protein EOR57_31340 [Mesorhizobium sp.]|uniref:hypothetical protein n=1 Tax=Mesorhizobium sp. TaxID=1871066 RepID=UPI000FE4542E|nr:hypothetical protein [Mesorhizobium sp.]RWL14841.1 MAG: hypothetical protein EOR57_31340 [Mesorhizobium sp.]
MTLTLEQMKANRKLWVEALRSGRYEQTKSTLVDSRGYCCLGVACVVAGKQDDEISDFTNLSDFKDVRKFFGIRDYDGDFYGGSLVCLNDDAGYTFEQIAEVIESEPPGLFVEKGA